jgi:hypothetical protein
MRGDDWNGCWYTRFVVALQQYAASKDGRSAFSSQIAHAEVRRMSDAGWVYVLINPSMEGLVKIGKTARDPSDRARELSGATGVPTPFVVAYDAYFDDCAMAEQFVHAYLEKLGYRVSPNREFFEAPLRDAIKAIMAAVSVAPTGVVATKTRDDDSASPSDAGQMDSAEHQPTVNPWDDLERQAKAFFSGEGETLQDYAEAIMLYKHAFKLGSPTACLHLALMHYQGHGCNEDLQVSLDYSKEGVKRGRAECYGQMARIFNETEHVENAEKCWARFFALGGHLVVPYGHGLAYHYWIWCKTEDLPVVHKARLLESSAGVQIFSAVTLDRARREEWNQATIESLEELHKCIMNRDF